MSLTNWNHKRRAARDGCDGRCGRGERAARGEWLLIYIHKKYFHGVEYGQLASIVKENLSYICRIRFLINSITSEFVSMSRFV